MNHYSLSCVICGVVFALHASAEVKMEKVLSEEFSLSSLYDEVRALKNRLEEMVNEIRVMKNIIDEKDDKINSLKGRDKLFLSQLEDLKRHSAVEPSFIVTATKTDGHIPFGPITYDDTI